MDKQVEPDQKIKQTKDKLPYELLRPEWDEGLAAVLAHGAKKYGANSWIENAKRVDVQFYLAAARRHINEYRKGENLDKDSGVEHLYHACINLLFICSLDRIAKKTFVFTSNDGEWSPDNAGNWSPYGEYNES